MKYSVIIPIYNAEDTLKLCIDSIRRSGLDNYEIVLVNDGSTDQTAAICESLRYNCSQIEYIFQENSGVSVARNNGIRHAKGEYILFCDADDYLENNCFSGIDDVLSGKIDLLIYGMSFDYYNKGICYRKDKMIYPYKEVQTVKKWSDDIDKMYLYNVLSSSCNKIYKKDIIVENELYFDEKMILLEDLIFSVTYLAYCNDIYFWDCIAYRYRQAENEKNAQKRLDRISSINDMMLCIKKYFESADMILEQRTGLHLKAIEKTCYRIYYMLISQKLYYSSCRQIKEISKEVIKGEYQDESKLLETGANTLKLYRQLKKKQFYQIRVHNMYSQLRHFFAVKYKSYLSRRGNKDEH